MEIIKLIQGTTPFKNFSKLVDADKISHAYFVYGEDELQNSVFCKLMALKLECNKLCYECGDCVKVLADVHPDVLNFPEGKNLLVGDAVKILEEINVLPMLATYKIFIVNNFNKATVQAQNKLLKSLEEPPKNVIFILNATSLNSVLPTILSRVQKIELMPLPKLELEKYLLNQNGHVDENALSEGGGWIGKTLKFNEDENFNKDCKFVEDMLLNMKTSRDVLKYSSVFSNKENFELRLNILEMFFEKMLFKNVSGEKTEVPSEAIAKIFEKINLAKKQFFANCNLNLITDNLLLGILEVKYLCK